MNAYRKVILLVLSLGLLVLGGPFSAWAEITKATIKVAGMT